MTTTTQTQPEGTYWHFLNEDRRLRYSDGREVTVGETLKVEGEIEFCSNGLHASKQAMDALKYAPGSVACLVTLGGDTIHGDDKSVARERTALCIFDATRLLREFACTVAENALLAERAAGREPDPRCFAAVEVTRQYMKSEATEREFAAAGDASWDAVDDFALCEKPAMESRKETRTPAWYSAIGAAQAAAAATTRGAADAAHAAVYAVVHASEKPNHSRTQDARHAEARGKQNEILTNMLLAEYAKDRTK